MSVENLIVIESWRWPQWFVVAIVVLALFCDTHCPQTEVHRYSVGAFVAARIFMNLVYFCGGFYDKSDIPQILMLALTGLGIILYMIDSVDCPTLETIPGDRIEGALNIVLTIAILTMGGFFA